MEEQQLLAFPQPFVQASAHLTCCKLGIQRALATQKIAQQTRAGHRTTVGRDGHIQSRLQLWIGSAGPRQLNRWIGEAQQERTWPCLRALAVRQIMVP
eukprot:scaffold237238_cov19-Tisochrysis_lutea.AAC.1